MATIRPVAMIRSPFKRWTVCSLKGHRGVVRRVPSLAFLRCARCGYIYTRPPA